MTEIPIRRLPSTDRASKPVYLLDAHDNVWKVWKIQNSAWPDGLSQVVCLSDGTNKAWRFEGAGPFRILSPSSDAFALPAKIVLELVGDFETEPVD